MFPIWNPLSAPWSATFVEVEYTLIGLTFFSAWMDPCILLGWYSKLGSDPKWTTPVVLRSRPLQTLTQFSLCLPGYLFENDSRVVPEKFEGEHSAPVIHPCIHTQIQLHATIHLARCYLDDSMFRRETLAIQSPTPISIPDLIVLYRRQESLCKRYMDLCVLRSLVSGFGFSAHTRCRAPLSRWERRRAVSHGVSGVGDWR